MRSRDRSASLDECQGRSGSTQNNTSSGNEELHGVSYAGLTKDGRRELQLGMIETTATGGVRTASPERVSLRLSLSPSRRNRGC